MGPLIEHILEEVFVDFRRTLDTMDSLCLLKTLRFDGTTFQTT